MRSRHFLTQALASVLLCCSALLAHAAPTGAGALPTAPEATLPATTDAGTDAISTFLRQSGLLSVSGAAPGEALQQIRDTASDLVLSAMNFLGVPYRRGGTSAENGFDCSGFTRHVFENSVGLLLPRRSRDQAQAPGLLDIRRDDLKPGDLVFFNTMRSAFSHVGIYVGDGKFIHSPRTGSQVRVEDMREAYWTKRYNGARRVPVVGGTASALPSRTGTPGLDTPPSR